MQNILPLQGTVQQYDWGGTQFLPEMLQLPSEPGKTYAEYWMGAHLKSSSSILIDHQPTSLWKAIQENPHLFLGDAINQEYGGLPFLFKILDVQQALSIQVHPSLSEAIEGYEREEQAGIPIDSPIRNYKDRNHKPEMMVALSDFWLLHGFCSPEIISSRLDEIPEFSLLKPLFNKDGLQAVYQFVMEMETADAFYWLLPLVKRAIRKMKAGELSKSEPDWWVARIFAKNEEPSVIDKAIFSIYILNIVQVAPGLAIFQGAGMPHAYLEGQCVELMSNSDNVLRAGLTTKHIDVPELIKLTRFETTYPDVLLGNAGLPCETNYPVPVNDFALTRVQINAQFTYEHISKSPEIWIVTEGGVIVNQQMVLKRGTSIFVIPGTEIQMTSSGEATLFRAWVP
ncbi:MAG: mannose-6-phosphate isomerase, class I [Sediminibacterium sp.]|nr:mannose-6-phosphate isomerase, class I [Sediminibacterium sp.]